jgi:cell wall-associated NlpC family hydrolase
MTHPHSIAPLLTALALAAAPAAAQAANGGTDANSDGGSASTGSSPKTAPHRPAHKPSRPAVKAPTSTTPVAGGAATLNNDGLASVPAAAPQQVKDVIAAANQIAHLYGGGHIDFADTAYDCSGSVSFALHGADLVTEPRTSGDLMTWGAAGPRQWITVYANDDHVFVIIAGLRFDTSGQKTAGSRWQSTARDLTGFTVRHPNGL